MYESKFRKTWPHAIQSDIERNSQEEKKYLEFLGVCLFWFGFCFFFFFPLKKQYLSGCTVGGKQVKQRAWQRLKWQSPNPVVLIATNPTEVSCIGGW